MEKEYILREKKKNGGVVGGNDLDRKKKGLKGGYVRVNRRGAIGTWGAPVSHERVKGASPCCCREGDVVSKYATGNSRRGKKWGGAEQFNDGEKKKRKGMRFQGGSPSVFGRIRSMSRKPDVRKKDQAGGTSQTGARGACEKKKRKGGRPAVDSQGKRGAL